MPTYCVVSAPVVNLRRRPVDAPFLNVHDDFQESQLLLNESLLVTGEEGDWLIVEAIEQPKHDPEDGWHGYPGWVRKRDVAEAAGPTESNGVITAPFAMVVAGASSKAPPVIPLSVGTRVNVSQESKGYLRVPLPGGRTGWISKKHVSRDCIDRDDPKGVSRSAVDVARLFLGVSYVWGGRSMPLPWSRGPIMGVDCSGLVDLAFRAVGIRLPRDAHDQWIATPSIEAEDLRKGDLIFLSRVDRQDQIVHVMLSLGGEQLIEAADTGGVVRMSTFREKLGLDLTQLKQKGLRTRGRSIYFGRVDETNTGRCHVQ